MQPITLSGKDFQSQKEKRTLTLTFAQDVSFDTTDVDDFVAQHKFSAKKEKHITFVGFGVGKKLVDKGVTDSEWEEFLKDFQQFSFMCTPIPVFYVIEKTYTPKGKKEEKRDSIIQLVALEGVDAFYDLFKKHFGFSITLFPHVTHYIKSTDPDQEQGIGVSSLNELPQLHARRVVHNEFVSFKKILLPTRPQVDTVIALTILKKLGNAIFKDIDTAEVLFNQQIPDAKPWYEHEAEGALLLDMGDGPLDHHVYGEKVCLSEMLATYLDVEKNKVIAKMVQLAHRDDIDGKGTISEDGLDRVFGISGLLVSLNRVHQENPQQVYEIIAPLLDAHYEEQYKRIELLPKLFEDMKKNGTARTLSAIQRGKKKQIVVFESNDPTLASYLRSYKGGNYDVVVQVRDTGHINILTHTNRRPDLRSLAVVIRKSELLLQEKEVDILSSELAAEGRVDVVPEWYLDFATNSLQNGGVNPSNTPATKISAKQIDNLVKVGIEESMWKPQE